MLSALPVVALALLAGCSFLGERPTRAPSRPTRVEASDRDAIVPSVRIGTNVHTTEPRTAPAHAQGGHGIEFSATRVRGHDHQILRTTEQPMLFGNQAFAPPQDLKNEFDFELYDLAYRWRPYFGARRRIGIEAFGGPGIASLDVRVTAATLSARETYDVVGLAWGAGFVYRFDRATSLRARITTFYGDAHDQRLLTHHFEVFAGHALSRHVALRAGYGMRQVWVEQDRDDLFSDITLRTSGPVVGLDVMF